MLNELIVLLFCRETKRNLRRLGLLGAVLAAFVAIGVELPLSVSIATTEAQAGIAAVDGSIESSVARLERHAREVRSRESQRTSRGHSSKPGSNTPRVAA